MSTSKRLFLNSQQARLCCVDFGGSGQPILLLHGLAGRANEWHRTAQWLVHWGHVFALEQRGHGQSEKGLGDYTRDARRIPHGRYAQVAHAGHDLHLDQPERWQQLAEEFLRGIEE